MMGDVVEQNSGGEPPIRYDNGHPVSSTCQAAETQKQQLTISTQEIPVQKDGKRSWCVCAAAYCIQVVILGVLHAFGVFFVAFIDEFKTTKSTTAWVGSGAYGICMFLATIASFLINRFGHRPVAAAGCAICAVALLASSFVQSIELLFFTFTLLYGTGAALAYTPTMCIAGEYFEKYNAIATGIMTSGSSCGTLLIAPCGQALVTSIGWRNTMRVLAGIQVLCVGCCMVIVPLPGSQKKRSAAHQIKRSFSRRLIHDLSLWKNKVFVIWIFAIFMVMFGYYIPYVHMIAYCEDLGIPATKGAILIMILGAATGTGRVLFGKIIQHGFIDRLHMHQLSMVVTGAGSMMLPLIHSFEGIVAYAVVIGLVDGCYVVLLPVLTTTWAGAENEVLAWGFVSGTAAFTFTLGPPVAGWIRDSTGSYNMSFHIAGIPVILGALILFLIPWAKRTATTFNALRTVETYETLTRINTSSALLDHQVDDGLPEEDALSGGAIDIQVGDDDGEVPGKRSISTQSPVVASSVPRDIILRIEALERISHSMVDLDGVNASRPRRRRACSECPPGQGLDALSVNSLQRYNRKTPSNTCSFNTSGVDQQEHIWNLMNMPTENDPDNSEDDDNDSTPTGTPALSTPGIVSPISGSFITSPMESFTGMFPMSNMSLPIVTEEASRIQNSAAPGVSYASATPGGTHVVMSNHPVGRNEELQQQTSSSTINIIPNHTAFSANYQEDLLRGQVNNNPFVANRPASITGIVGGFTENAASSHVPHLEDVSRTVSMQFGNSAVTSVQANLQQQQLDLSATRVGDRNQFHNGTPQQHSSATGPLLSNVGIDSTSQQENERYPNSIPRSSDHDLMDPNTAQCQSAPGNMGIPAQQTVMAPVVQGVVSENQEQDSTWPVSHRGVPPSN